MRTEQLRWTETLGWSARPGEQLGKDANVAWVFGGSEELQGTLGELRQAYPSAHIIGCSTAGEIEGTIVHDHSVVVTAAAFDSSRVESVWVQIDSGQQSHAAGSQLARELDHQGLVHVFVLSDGLLINGSELVRGLAENLPASVSVTGGLSADGERFEKTSVVANGRILPNGIVALGFYGDQLKVGYGSLGGWDPFGPERLITRSEGNVLFDLDGRSALDLYELYLGHHAEQLPASGLLFPLSIRTEARGVARVRTILAIDRQLGSITFAGDIPEGAYARFMKANFDRLIDGAVGAAETSARALGAEGTELAVLISCVGRKLVLQQRIEEEVEGVHDALDGDAVMTGFYSYGEISPFTPSAKCELHNQTMTVTTFTES